MSFTIPHTFSQLAQEAKLVSLDENFSSVAAIINTVLSGGGVPTGAIIMWSGTIATIPEGWALCDGTNGTPNLVNRFIVGSSIDAGGQSVTSITGGNTKTGGTSNAIVVQHSHTITDPGHFHTVASRVSGGGWDNAAGSSDPGNRNTDTKTTGISINQSGQSGTNQNLPPYFALAYIMKL